MLASFLREENCVCMQTYLCNCVRVCVCESDVNLMVNTEFIKCGGGGTSVYFSVNCVQTDSCKPVISHIDMYFDILKTWLCDKLLRINTIFPTKVTTSRFKRIQLQSLVFVWVHFYLTCGLQHVHVHDTHCLKYKNRNCANVYVTQNFGSRPFVAHWLQVQRYSVFHMVEAELAVRDFSPKCLVSIKIKTADISLIWTNG